MNNLTPGEWRAVLSTWGTSGIASHFEIIVNGATIGRAFGTEAEGNGELWAASRDHALLLRAMVAGDAWTEHSGHEVPKDVRVCVKSVRDPLLCRLTTLDATGCPVLTPEIRAALERLEKP